MERLYSYNISIDKDRDNYFRYFAQKFFGDLFWFNVQTEEKTSSIFLLAFHTLILKTCELDKDTSLIIVYNSLFGKRISFNPDFDEFQIIFDKINSKFGKVSIIPLLNRNLKKTFESFEDMYHMFETKMFNEGKMKNGIVKFIYKDKELLKLE